MRERQRHRVVNPDGLTLVVYAVRKVTKALEDQSRRLWHCTNVYMHPNIHEYVEKLVAKMPGNLKVRVIEHVNQSHSSISISESLCNFNSMSKPILRSLCNRHIL